MRIEHDKKVNSSLLSRIHKIEQDLVKVDTIIDEIEKYKAAIGSFGYLSASRGRTTKSPGY